MKNEKKKKGKQWFQKNILIFKLPEIKEDNLRQSRKLASIMLLWLGQNVWNDKMCKSFWNCQHVHLSLRNFCENAIFWFRAHFGSPLFNYSRLDPSENGFKPDIFLSCCNQLNSLWIFRYQVRALWKCKQKTLK